MTTVELYGGPRDGLRLEIPFAPEDAVFPLVLRLPASGHLDWAVISEATDGGPLPLLAYQLESGAAPAPRACPRYRWEGLSG